MIKPLLIGLVRLLTGVRARWQGCEPALLQRIYFANHTSNLDAVVVWASLPPAIRRRTRPVAAQDYWTRSALRRYIAERVLSVVLIERRKVTVKSNPLTPMLAALDAGSSLIIFPEGEEVGAFKGGIYHLACHRPDVQLIPTWIDNINRVLPKGEVLPIPMLGSVTIGAPIRIAEAESKDAFLQRARTAVLALRPSS
jgi:1-acyl-sn-glycerol-3-phosphate acyltransferase